MASERLPGHEHGPRSAAVVRGWVDLYTRGLPAVLRDRRREEVAADLADEDLLTGSSDRPASRDIDRLSRLLRGLPADLSWRLTDARALARAVTPGRPFMPATRPAFLLLGFTALFALVGVAVSLRVVADSLPIQERWAGWGFYGFLAASVLVLVGCPLAIRWPRLGALVAGVGAAIGLAASPWLWLFWLLVPIALAVRLYRPDTRPAAPLADISTEPGPPV